MKILIYVFLPVLCGEILLAPVATAQTQRLIDICANRDNAYSPDQRIEGCTALIQGGRVFGVARSWAFNNLCSAYNDKREGDLAIAACNATIEFDPDARAYRDRGNAYYIKGDSDSAIANYNQAIRLQPSDVIALDGRAKAHYMKGDFDNAINDYGRLIQLDPNDAQAYLDRGIAYYFKALLGNALSDLQRSQSIDSKNAYTIIWLDIVRKRARSKGELSGALKLLDMTRWPAPIVRLYMGRMMPADVVSSASDPDTVIEKGHTCEAAFYSGEWALQHAKKDEARKFFTRASEICPKSYRESMAARTELNALGAAP